MNQRAAQCRPKGVTWKQPRWRATFRYRGQRHWLGLFATAEQAAAACEAARKRLGAPSARAGSRSASLQGGQWIARIVINGRRVWLGRYDTAAEAAKAYQTALAQKRLAGGRS